MRDRPTGRMLSLTGLLFTALFVAIGCQSTSVTRDPNGTSPRTLAAQNPPAGSSEITWKKTNAPSAALAQEYWTKPDQAVKATAFQTPAQAEWMPPIPQVMLKDELTAAPTIERRVGLFRHHGKPAPAPIVLPNAPNEGIPVTLPSYVIRPPDVLLIELMPQFTRENLKLKPNNIGLLNQPIFGQHLVRPDGTVELGIYGSVVVANETVQSARKIIAKKIYDRLDKTPKKPPEVTIEEKDVEDNLKVDVLTYNSSVYYVITDGAGLGQQVYRLPVTGHETVLDAISHINGLPVVASRHIWVARKNPGHPGPDSILPVDWKGISELGATSTNWQLMPGDRVFVQSDPIRRFNNNLAKVLEPIERLLGVTLLGSQTVNTIKNGTTVVR